MEGCVSYEANVPPYSDVSWILGIWTYNYIQRMQDIQFLIELFFVYFAFVHMLHIYFLSAAFG